MSLLGGKQLRIICIVVALCLLILAFVFEKFSEKRKLAKIIEKQKEIGIRVSRALREAESREAEARQQAARLELLAEVGRVSSGINHELRNVLAPIKSEVEELALLRIGAPEFKDSLKILHRNLASAERLMQSLKVMSKPIALKVERLNLTDLVDEVLTDAKLLGPAATVKFEASISPVALYAYGDRQWLHHVLFNLVKNAVESLQGRPNPKVTVSTAAMDSMVRIDVTDNGHGIDPATLQCLFEPFFSTKGAGGTGLGLVVSRKVVELHGGKLEIKSDAGQGTTFSVLLPKEGVGSQSETTNTLIR